MNIPISKIMVEIKNVHTCFLHKSIGSFGRVHNKKRETAVCWCVQLLMIFAEHLRCYFLCSILCIKFNGAKESRIMLSIQFLLSGS